MASQVQSLKPEHSKVTIESDTRLNAEADKLFHLLNMAYHVKILPSYNTQKIELSVWLNSSILNHTFGSAFAYNGISALRAFKAQNISELDLDPGPFSGFGDNFRFAIDSKTNPMLTEMIDHFFDKLKRKPSFYEDSRAQFRANCIAENGYCVESNRHVCKTTYLMTVNEPPEVFQDNQDFRNHIDAYLKHARDQNLWKLVTPHGKGEQKFIGINVSSLEAPLGFEEAPRLQQAFANFYNNSLLLHGINCELTYDKSLFEIQHESERSQYLILSTKQDLDLAVACEFVFPELAKQANYSAIEIECNGFASLKVSRKDELEACYTSLSQAIDGYFTKHPHDASAVFLSHFFKGTFLNTDNSSKASIERIEKLARIAIAYRGADIDISLIDESSISITLESIISNQLKEEQVANIRIEESLFPSAQAISEEVINKFNDARATLGKLSTRRMMIGMFVKGSTVLATSALSLIKEDTKNDNSQSNQLRKEFIVKCKNLAKEQNAETAEDVYGKLFDDFLNINQANTGLNFGTGVIAGSALETLAETAIEHLLSNEGFATIYIEVLIKALRPRIQAILNWNMKLPKSGFVDLG
jgi:hypothetical protein